MQPLRQVQLDASWSQVREALIEQLHIPWSLASRHYLPALEEEDAMWQPATHVVTVHRYGEVWAADWPDEESTPLPSATIGWLLWHIEWWWTNALLGARGGSAVPPSEHRWSGSVGASRAALESLHEQWLHVLGTADLSSSCPGPWPTPQRLVTIAGWVNVELAKNVAEIGQLIRLRRNQI